MKLLIVAAVAALAPAMAQVQAFDLVCEGVASISTTQSSEIDTGISNGFGTNHTMTMETKGVQNSGATVAVRIREDGTGEVKLPGWSLPLWVSRSQDGWRPITDLVVADDKITGRFKLNALNVPAFAINRKTGRMQLNAGGGSFRGDCAKAPDKDAPNKF